MASIFSMIVDGKIPSYKIAENDKYYAFLDINPLNEGHTLVIPKREEDYIFDLEDEELTGLILFAKEVAKSIKSGLKCKRVALVVLGMEVAHAHIHLIPMNSESDVDFRKEKLKFSKEQFESTVKKIMIE